MAIFRPDDFSHALSTELGDSRLSLEGFARRSQKPREISFALGKQCHTWVEIPFEMIEFIECIGREFCDLDEERDFVRLHMQETRDSQSKVYADLIRAAQLGFGTSTKDWSWKSAADKFSNHGCSESGCYFNQPGGCQTFLCCALNLSDALIRTGYSLPGATDVKYCNHKRVRNADGMARVCNKQNGGKCDVQGWKNRPTWKGIVYFEGDLRVDYASHIRATGHIDFWDGKKALHAEYPNANVVWFWRMGA